MNLFATSTTLAQGDGILSTGTEPIELARLQVQLFIELTRLLSTNLAPPELVAALFDLVRQVLSAEFVILVRLEGDQQQDQAWIHPLNAENAVEQQEFFKNLARHYESPGFGSVSHPAENTPVQAFEHPDFPNKSLLVAPLLHSSAVLGTLIIQSEVPQSGHSALDLQVVSAVARQLAGALETERAISEARLRSDQLAAFSVVASTVNEWLDVEQLSRRFLAVLLNTTGTTTGLFYLLEANDAVRLVAQFGVPAEHLSALRLTKLAHHPVALRAIEQGHVVVLDNLGDAEISSQARQLAERLSLSSAILLPLRVKGHGVGLVILMRPDATVRVGNREFLQGLADQAAQAIENARLFGESERRFQEQSALRELAQHFLGAASPDQVLERTLDTLANLVPGHYTEVLLPDSAGTFILANGRGWRRGVIGRTRVVNDPHFHAGYVLHARSPIIVDDFAVETRFQPADYLTRHHVTSAVCAPMLAEMRVIGMLGIYSRKPRRFTEEQSRLLYLVAAQTAIALEKARHSQDSLNQAASLSLTLTELQGSYQAILLALSAALDARDRETEGHSQRVTRLALTIGRRLDLSQAELTNLERGALLHDVGKIGISDNILLKAGPLSPAERAVMNRHPQLGYEMLRAIPFLKDALPVVLHHQEMYDGSGYPAGLRGQEIPLGARIFAVADTYDAMTSIRPYRRALSHEQALAEILRCSGTQFDPRVVAAFLTLDSDILPSLPGPESRPTPFRSVESATKTSAS
jgi:HD-GYP domain-containing protein (c-di-GMP phosphodiesterase class II)